MYFSARARRTRRFRFGKGASLALFACKAYGVARFRSLYSLPPTRCCSEYHAIKHSKKFTGAPLRLRPVSSLRGPRAARRKLKSCAQPSCRRKTNAAHVASPPLCQPLMVVSSLHPPQAACSPSRLRLASGGRLASLSRRCATRGGRSSGCRWRRSTRACP